MHKDCTPTMWRAKPCSEWQGRLSQGGWGAPGAGRYGIVTWNGQGEYAHRVAFALSHGVLVEQLTPLDVVAHHCDNPLCFEPLHLFLTTKAGNNQDMWRKGRANTAGRPHGVAHHAARLTEDQVRAIRDEYAAGGTSAIRLARRYGVGKGTIADIVARRSWVYLD